MSKAGRPTKMTPEVLSKLEHAFSIGCTDLEACVYADISQRLLYDYQSKNEEFLHRKELLKSKPVLKARTNVMNDLNAGDKQTSQWYLERKAKDEFSLKHDVNASLNHSGSLGISNILGEIDGQSSGLPEDQG